MGEQLKKDLIAKYGNIREAIVKTGVPKTTLGDYLSGKTGYMSEKTRVKIYEATSFEYLSKPFEQVKEKTARIRGKEKGQLELQLQNVFTSLNNLRRLVLQSGSEEEKAQAKASLILSDEEKAVRASDLIYAFINETKDFSSEARKKFIKKFSEEDAGYLISLINYIYNPDKHAWVGRASYPIKKKK